ncbi:MAG: hypothetical protein HY644_03875 [Acidobacteria bacterium]|nr:hypothetical protein [Acidobacteriota bacterium]
MKSIVGIFASRLEAERATKQLRSAGVTNINFLVPGASEQKVAAVPTVEAEQPGMGKALGGVVGGALGAAVLPGVGPVIAIGVVGAGLLGAIIGAISGAVLGEALEDSFVKGLPIDELYLYKDALRKGRTVVIAFADDAQATEVQQVLQQAGVESLDPAREDWWIGLRDVEEEKYVAQGKDSRAKPKRP